MKLVNVNNDKNAGMSPLSNDQVSFLHCIHQQSDFYFKKNKKEHHTETDGVAPEIHAFLILF